MQVVNSTRIHHSLFFHRFAGGCENGWRAYTRLHKYWPTANRVDNVYGDRNLFCACVPVSDYQ